VIFVKHIAKQIAVFRDTGKKIMTVKAKNHAHLANQAYIFYPLSVILCFAHSRGIEIKIARHSEPF
jgi:hypothetical protein